jgi:hypothetical protein
VSLILNDCFGDVVETGQTDDDGNYMFLNAAASEYAVGVNGFSGGTSDSLYEAACQSLPSELGEGETLREDRNISKKDWVLIEPLEGVTLGEFPTFSWEAYPDADFYDVSLFQREPDFAQIFLNSRTSETSLVSPVALKSGSSYDGYAIAYNVNGIAIASVDIKKFSVRFP